MKKRFLLLIISFIFLISVLTFFLILNYLDPYQYRLISIISIVTTFIFWVSTFCSLFLYFIKKIYFRWKVYLFHVLSSFRQGIFISFFIVSLFFFNIIWAPLLLTWLLVFIFLFFLELLINNIKNYKKN